jgi:Kef-type K+ transport system membrane component KefB
VSLGILVDFKSMDLNVLWFLLALTLIGIITKVVGCGISAKLLGMDLRDSMVIGFGMTPRGEVAMIVALIGLNRGMIDQPLYAAVVGMSLITTIIPPVIIRNWIYGKSRGTE